MADIIIDIPELEQGTIGSSGNDSSSTRVRSPGYFTLPESADNISASVSAEAVNGKTVYTNIMGYGSGGNLVSDYGWKLSGEAVTLSQEVTSFRICLRYSDSSSIYPSDIQSCSAKFSYVPLSWHIGENGFPTNTEFIDAPEKAMDKPYPLAMWRIEANTNEGFPFNKLLLGISGIDIWALERENVIRVYDISEPQDGFKSNGLAILHPISCTSKHNDDVWDVNLVHPLDEWGKWKYLIVQNILKVDGQLFRIDSQSLETNEQERTMTVHASHITCDLADDLIFSASFSGGNGTQFIDFCKSSIDPSPWKSEYTPYKFDIHSDIDTVQGADEFENVTLWAALVGADNCMINRYGGELYRDNFYVSINKRMQYAKDDAFNLRYSLDVKGITQEIDYSDFCTQLHTIDNWGNEFWVIYQGVKWAIHHNRTRSVKFNYPESDGAMENLSRDSMAYWETVSVPKVTYKVQIASLKNDPRYADFIELQNYNYGDSGTIYCPELDINTKQKIIEVEKDEVTGDVISMALGNVRESIIRPKYMGSTISSGNTAGDKQLQTMQDKLSQLEFEVNIPYPIATIVGEYLTTSVGEYLQYKGE